MMGRHSTDLSIAGAGRPVPLFDPSCSRRQSRLPDPQKKKKKKSGTKWSLDPTTTSKLVSGRATSSTGRLRVVKVSGWGLQTTLGSGPWPWSHS